MIPETRVSGGRYVVNATAVYPKELHAEFEENADMLIRIYFPKDARIEPMDKVLQQANRTVYAGISGPAVEMTGRKPATFHLNPVHDA